MQVTKKSVLIFFKYFWTLYICCNPCKKLMHIFFLLFRSSPHTKGVLFPDTTTSSYLENNCEGSEPLPQDYKHHVSFMSEIKFHGGWLIVVLWKKAMLLTYQPFNTVDEIYACKKSLAMQVYYDFLHTCWYNLLILNESPRLTHSLVCKESIIPDIRDEWSGKKIPHLIWIWCRVNTNFLHRNDLGSLYWQISIANGRDQWMERALDILIHALFEKLFFHVNYILIVVCSMSNNSGYLQFCC